MIDRGIFCNEPNIKKRNIYILCKINIIDEYHPDI